MTITERRILCDVAAGLSNAEIAEDYSVTVSTVRKHLENTYRKLGVTNRMAAVARLRGSDEPTLDLRERVKDTPEREYRSDTARPYPGSDVDGTAPRGDQDVEDLHLTTTPWRTP